MRNNDGKKMKVKMQRNCDCDWKKGNSKKRYGRCGIQIKSQGKS